MAAMVMCGDWLVTVSGKTLTAVHTRESREAFVLDCSAVEQTEKQTTTPATHSKDDKDDKDADDGGGAAGDGILAVAASASGRLVAVTDDRKRLILLSTQPAWSVLSCRCVVRRCTALAFSRDEECVWAADKSGDVYSFPSSHTHTHTHTHTPGTLQLGHLSMLLALVVSPDDRFVITADRDEKIRVSLKAATHNIQAYCLGHTQFVSCLFLPPCCPDRLLSGSGDGLVMLWEYSTGRRLQSLDMREIHQQPEDERLCVRRISSSTDGKHLAVLCDGLPRLQLFAMTSDKATPTQSLPLPSTPRDTTFDLQGRLWILLDDTHTPAVLYTHTGDSWEQCDAGQPDLKRVTDVLTKHNLPLPGVCVSQLYKVAFDNTATYRQRKEERLQKTELNTNTNTKAKAKASPQRNGAKRPRHTHQTPPSNA
ncbi:tRNA (guanine-N(7)-)-methyltransferase non-catalytic subunit wdr4 [Engraulis encrasicolus]|uniref:tRNA (guanine-N(7)-)-methyltransferase non-catalytic subunit wdr4 n=1 Tax=Engraulis encrasicolus TaxID=184585 RepID=UPI002FD674B1